MERLDQNSSCHGTLECLHRSSSPRIIGRVIKLYQKPSSYVRWWLENLGWRASLKQALVKAIHPWSWLRSRSRSPRARAGHACTDEVLDLQPGELVEVKPVEEILATLDGRRGHKGLLWMTGMQKYCGMRCRVHRRVERIMLESNGQMRNMKHTVLLERATCDGAQFGGCDRSCFHFWREVWLRRVTHEQTGLGLGMEQEEPWT